MNFKSLRDPELQARLKGAKTLKELLEIAKQFAETYIGPEGKR